jgi:hypothetical protein
MARGLKRHRCKGCGKTFGALTGTPLSGLHRKEMWLTFGECLSDGDTVKTSAERCGIAMSTAFRWRHRFLRAVESGASKLRGIVEADETFIPASCKGSRAWKRAKEGNPTPDLPDRKARKRGGKAAKPGLSHEWVPVLVAAPAPPSAPCCRRCPPPTCRPPWRRGSTRTPCWSPTAAPAVRPAQPRSGFPTRCSTSQPASGELLHIQTVNSRHSQLKNFLRSRRGIATKYLGSYLSWFHLIVLHAAPTPRYCLKAAMEIDIHTVCE